MIGDVVRVYWEQWAYNATKYGKERLTEGDIFLVISDEGYVRAVRLKDLCIFTFSKNAFELYMLPYLEWFEE